MSSVLFIGLPGIAPHDLRRTCAKLCLEQIELLLGHASVQTTERYLGTKQDLVHAPCGAGDCCRAGTIGGLDWRTGSTHAHRFAA